jgi:serine/threonine-protein kinase 24/25/MST4
MEEEEEDGAPLPSSALLVNRFQLLELVGRGTTGVVHRALDVLNNNETVAIKLVDLEECEDDVLDIQREINVLANCDSPHVTKYLGSWLVPKTSTLAIAMEYMGGGSVQDLCRETPLDERIVRVLMRDVVKALKYLHEEGKIHRDVKCANILLNENGEVRLADFGVSGQMTQTIGARRKTFAGTPFWMAPEVIQSSGTGGFDGPSGYDEKADIWSLGITAIEAATGSAPHAHLHPMRALFVIPQSAPPELPYTENNEDNEEDGGVTYNFSEEFRDFVKQCVKMNPEERPSAEELLKHPFLKVGGVNAAESASNDASTSTVGNKTSNGESNNASAEEREEVSTIIAEAKNGAVNSAEKVRRQTSSLASELTAPPPDASTKEEKKGKTRRKKPPPPLHSPPRPDRVNTKKVAENEENDVEVAEVDKKKNSAEERTTPSENGSEETATTPSTQKEADEDFASSPRSSNHSTMSGSQKSRPESSIGNSSWDFGSGALGRRYSKKLQDQQKQKSPTASNSSLDPLSPKSRFKLDGNEALPRTSLLLKNHVGDALRDLKIPKREADAVFSALVVMEIAVAGSIDAFFNSVYERSVAKDGNDDHALSRDKEQSSERSVLAEYLLSRWRDDLIREEVGYYD